MKRIRLNLQSPTFRRHNERYSVPFTLLFHCLATGCDEHGTQCKLFSRRRKGKQRDWVYVVCKLNLRPYFQWLYGIHVKYDIPCCSPERLNDLADEFASEPVFGIDGRVRALLHNFLQRLFSYDHFVKGEQLQVSLKGLKDGFVIYKASWLGAQTGTEDEWNAWKFYDALVNNHEAPIRHCPYCNADTLYAFTFIKKRANENGDVREKLSFARSALDHFYPCNAYPILAITISNLVPSCTRCNSRFKLDENVGLKDSGLINPYVDDMDAHFRFTWGDQIFEAIRCALKSEDLRINYRFNGLEECNSVEATLEMFHIKDVYEKMFAREICDIPRILDEIYSRADSDSARIMRVEGSGADLDMSAGWTDSRKRLLLDCPMSRTGINGYRLSKVKMDLVEELENNRHEPFNTSIVDREY